MCVLSCVWLFATPWTVAHQAPLSMEFSRQEYWSGLPFPSPGDCPDPEIKTESPVSPTLASGFFTTAPPEKRVCVYIYLQAALVFTLNLFTMVSSFPSSYIWLIFWLVGFIVKSCGFPMQSRGFVFSRFFHPWEMPVSAFLPQQRPGLPRILSFRTHLSSLTEGEVCGQSNFSPLQVICFSAWKWK